MSIERFGEFKNKCTDERKQGSKFFGKSKTLKQRPNFEKTLWPSDCMVAQTDGRYQFNLKSN